MRAGAARTYRLLDERCPNALRIVLRPEWSGESLRLSMRGAMPRIVMSTSVVSLVYCGSYMATLSVKVDDEFVTRVDLLAEEMSARAGGAKVTRSNAMRVALVRGVEVLEAEFSMKKSKPKR